MLAIIVSCGSKSVSKITGNAKEDFMALHAEIEANHDNWDHSDWAAAIETYKTVAEEIKEQASTLSYEDWDVVDKSLFKSNMPNDINESYKEIRDAIKGYAKSYAKEAKKKAEAEAAEQVKKDAKEAIEMIKEAKEVTEQ